MADFERDADEREFLRAVVAGLADLEAGRELSLAEAKDRFQARYINKVLELNGQNRTKTARDLGVDPRTIFRHLEKQLTPIPPEDGVEGLTVGPADAKPPRL